MRKFALLILFAFILSLVAAPAFAQETVFCGDLAAADCDLLKANADAMAAVTSGAAEFELQLNIENIPNTPNLEVNISGDGTYSIDTALMSLAEELAVMEGQEAFDVVLEAIAGFDATLNLNISLPAEIAAQAGLPSGNIVLELALVDGVGYINFDTVDALMGGMLSQMGFTGWAGLDFIDVLQNIVASSPEILDTFSSSFEAGLSATTITDASSLEAINQYLSIERRADMDNAAVFVTTIDFGGLVADPVFADLLKASMEAQGQTMSDSEFSQAIAIFQVVGQSIEITATSFIDLRTNYTVRAEVSVVADLTSLLAAAGTPADGDAVISLTGSLDYSGLGETTVSAPNAPVAKFTDLMQLAGSTSGN